nr:hypothetical protein [Prevotella sp.]
MLHIAFGDNFMAFGVRFLRANVRNMAFGVRFLRANVGNVAFGVRGDYANMRFI